MATTKATKAKIKPNLNQQLENQSKKHDLVEMVLGKRIAFVHPLEVENFKTGGFIIK